MKKLIFIFFIFSFSMHAQLNKNIWYASALQFGGGVADGTNQSYIFHNHGQFGNIKPNAEAWKNKWKIGVDGSVLVGQERFWGSSRWFVGFTDFHHTTRFVENRLNEASGLVYSYSTINYTFNKKKRLKGQKIRSFKKGKIFRKKWYWYLADFAIISASRSAGFYSSYNIVFK